MQRSPRRKADRIPDLSGLAKPKAYLDLKLNRFQRVVALGQHSDSKIGDHYNYFRDYDPAVGRYVESDPIGLRGGLNLVAYVRGDPLRRGDPFGLIPDGADPECFRRGDCKCATPECGAGLKPIDPQSWDNLPPEKKCEYKCSLIFGSICKPAYKVPHLLGKIGAYIGCEVGVEYVCGWVCENKNMCIEMGKSLGRLPAMGY